MEKSALKSPRLLSLDIFRGGTVALMILVNNAGDSKHKYSQLNHSEWNGFTLTDLVFPCFLFMVGVSIVFAMERKKKEGNHGKIILSAFKRMVWLILISWAILLFVKHQVPDDVTTITAKAGYLLTHLRIPGVLQRIGVVFFLTTILYLKTSSKSQNIVLAAILVGYFVLLCFVPVPYADYPSLAPADNWGAWIDRAVFGTTHLYKIQWDPEGLLSTLPSIASCLIGVRAGEWLKRNNVEPGDKVSWLFVYGIGAIVLALFWHIFFPINKKLWTSSYVLLTGGIALNVLAFTYWLVDIKGRQRFTWPLVVFGMNALMAYIVSDIIRAVFNMMTISGMDGMVFIQNRLVAPCFSSPYNASLAGSIVIVLLCWLPMYVLYRRKIYIKV
ncbi:putative acyltransferase [Mucilaginibacter yixingensis]|uniref:Putative acyltransferase n=1 Tax=Mucilaginibacter yixingensis TaxID=1295612 RepID=A0A2T5J674_9SPHI|nr:heparan-alpha-glucosaminide N-acetyltransferase domain-containing protein [Mucilaginibacter yixingensis]PTQ93971.1 putative acyltransferase [Mucilaginibacter yixingensis]